MEWTQGVPNAIQLTKTRDTLLFILVEPHAPPTLPRIATASLHKFLFPHPAIQLFISTTSLVSLKLVAEPENHDYQSFIQFFAVADKLPQLFLISPKGLVIWQQSGYVSPRQFIQAACAAFKTIDRQLDNEDHFFKDVNISITPTELVIDEPPAESKLVARDLMPSDAPEETAEPALETVEPALDQDASSTQPKPLPSTEQQKPVIAKTPSSSLSLTPPKSRLHIRLPDSTQVNLEYPSSTPLSTILSALSETLETPQQNITLCTAFPRQTFDGSHYSSSLLALGLHPASTLIATVAKAPGSTNSEGVGLAAAIGRSRVAGYVSGFAGVVTGFVRSIVQDAPGTEGAQGRQAEQGERQRERGEPDERTLRFNGNSTQYGYDDGDGR